MYIFSLPVLVFASAGVAMAPSTPALLFWRLIQSIGASPGMVLGAGVIGDIYKLEERGRAMGIFFAVCDSVVNLISKKSRPFDSKACLLGPALSPLMGGKYNPFPQKGTTSKRSLSWLGAAAYYYSWRAMQGSLGVVGFLTFCMIYCWFPETSQPGSRGIDKMRAKRKHQRSLLFYQPSSATAITPKS